MSKDVDQPLVGQDRDDEEEETRPEGSQDQAVRKTQDQKVETTDRREGLTEDPGNEDMDLVFRKL